MSDEKEASPKTRAEYVRRMFEEIEESRSSITHFLPPGERLTDAEYQARREQLLKASTFSEEEAAALLSKKPDPHADYGIDPGALDRLSRLENHDIPTVKPAMEYRPQPVRILGESEVRLMANVGDYFKHDRAYKRARNTSERRDKKAVKQCCQSPKDYVELIFVDAQAERRQYRRGQFVHSHKNHKPKRGNPYRR